MDFSDMRRLKSMNEILCREDEKFVDFSRRRSENLSNEVSTKSVLIIYASGSMGANKDLQIERGGLKRLMEVNFYLCDIEHSKRCDSKLEYLMTPVQQNGIRIRYKIQELERIDSSINLTIMDIKMIATLIQKHYNECNAFIVVTGLDTICHVGTSLSFMLEHLSKLVICTGGYLPLSRMRNDSVSNLVECFSVVAEASSINDVLIVSKNKGFRANRCIKMTQGDFENISSPNLPALCSIKTKLRVRSYLFQPPPQNEFSIFTELSNKVKVLRMNQHQCLQSLAYELKNPYVKGMIIKSFSFANIPNFPELLTLFKEAYEDESRKTIFINISEAIVSKNDSLMKRQLESFHIYYGGDMTQEAALSKLSYLIGKGLPEQFIIKQMQTNLRGELTEEKEKFQYTMRKHGMMEVVDEVLNEYFPTTLKDLFYYKIQSNVSRFLIKGCLSSQFKQIFWHTKHEDAENNKSIGYIADEHCLLHRAVDNDNIDMAQFLIEKGADVNLQNQSGCSPLLYAIKNCNKPMIQLLSKNGSRVIAQNDQLFEMFVQAIKKDDVQFFNLLYHTEFKETMRSIKNVESRTVAHIAGLLKASKCYQLMKQKFSIPVNEKDGYERTASQYFSGRCEA